MARSGTTLLRLMLDAHAELAIPPETDFIPAVAEAWTAVPGRPAEALAAMTGHPRWPDFHIDARALEREVRGGCFQTPDQLIRSFYGLYARHQGKPRWGDKSVSYTRCLAQIGELLPEAAFVHLIRDGRDVFLSIRDRWFGPSQAGEVARWWRSGIEEARRQAGPRYVEVRFEELVIEPEPTLRALCEFLSLEWDPAILSYHQRAAERTAETDRDIVWPRLGRISAANRMSLVTRTSQPPDRSRIGRWKRELLQREIDEFQAAAGETLADLGYPSPSG